MRVVFVHYSFQQDGVTRTVLNNIKGLRKIDNTIEFVLAGSSFSNAIPKNIKQRYVNWNDLSQEKKLNNFLEDADVVVFENPVVGVYPQATSAFKKFTENNPHKRVIYRIHDFIDDRPHLLKNFLSVIPEGVNEIYPKSDNVSFLVLTSRDKERLLNKGINEVEVLPNSIVFDDLKSNPKHALKLRKLLEEKKIIQKEERILLYPVRLERRKNIEEALLITKMLNDEGENYRLIVTIPFIEEYQKEVSKLAKDFKIKSSLGEVSKYIGFDRNKGFTIGDLYSIADVVITTSVMEGFGFAFIEPWLLGTPVFGRRLPEVTDDFEMNKINLSHLYGNENFEVPSDPNERILKIREILSNENAYLDLSKKLNLKNRIKMSRRFIEENKFAIKKSYESINVAQKFLSYMKPIVVGLHTK